MHPIAYAVVAFGAFLVLTGIILFLKRGAQGTTSIRILGVEFTGGPSLLVCVLGVILIILPFIRKEAFPQPEKRVGEAPESSSIEQRTSGDNSPAIADVEGDVTVNVDQQKKKDAK